MVWPAKGWPKHLREPAVALKLVSRVGVLIRFLRTFGVMELGGCGGPPTRRLRVKTKFDKQPPTAREPGVDRIEFIWSWDFSAAGLGQWPYEQTCVDTQKPT